MGGRNVPPLDLGAIICAYWGVFLVHECSFVVVYEDPTLRVPSVAFQSWFNRVSYFDIYFWGYSFISTPRILR